MDIITKHQKWRREYPNNVVLKIYELNKENSTFSGTFGIIRGKDELVEFPLQGQYSPEHTLIGWVVSYQSALGYENDHAIGVWVGNLECIFIGLEQTWSFGTNHIAVHEEPFNTTMDYTNFVPDNF